MVDVYVRGMREIVEHVSVDIMMQEESEVQISKDVYELYISRRQGGGGGA